jgi:hypothetical protein
MEVDRWHRTSELDDSRVLRRLVRKERQKRRMREQPALTHLSSFVW